MKIETNEEYKFILKEVYNGISLETTTGETFEICMRDNGFEFNYGGRWYEAKDYKIKRLDGTITVPIGDLPIKKAKEALLQAWEDYKNETERKDDLSSNT